MYCHLQLMAFSQPIASENSCTFLRPPMSASPPTAAENGIGDPEAGEMQTRLNWVRIIKPYRFAREYSTFSIVSIKPARR